MTGVALVLALAVTVEALVEYGKSMIQAISCGGWKTAVVQLSALAVSVLLCILAGADLFAPLGIQLGGTMGGCIFTGILSARGANYTADLVSHLQHSEE